MTFFETNHLAISTVLCVATVILAVMVFGIIAINFMLEGVAQASNNLPRTARFATGIF